MRNKDQNKEENKALAEFKQNMKNIGDAVSDAVDSDDTFAEKANDALDNFETKLENFENKAEGSGEEVSESTQNTLDNLKQQSKELKQQLNELTEESGNKADELKASIKDGLKKFGNDVKDFVSKQNQD